MTLTAVTIARDEAAVIDRCLDSTAGLVDVHVVIDTGSTDDTLARVDRHAHAVITSRPWVDFGTNLTEALHLAGSHGDWVLRLDADMTVDAHPGLTDWLADGAAADAYHVTVHDGTLDYRLPLLTRTAAGPWRYIGATHEALDVGDRRAADVTGLDVTHHADGGHRTDKHTRDLALLAAGVAAGEPRATYYAAQAHWCLGHIDKAVDLYRARAAMTGGWEEERWHAAYRAADLTGDIDALLDAWRQRPWRPEPLDAARRHTATAGPSTDRLFLEPAAWRT